MYMYVLQVSVNVWKQGVVLHIHVFVSFLSTCLNPSEDAGGLSWEYVLRIPNVS